MSFEQILIAYASIGFFVGIMMCIVHGIKQIIAPTPFADWAAMMFVTAAFSCVLWPVFGLMFFGPGD